jgi:DNA sulfur modification protein DndE
LIVKQIKLSQQEKERLIRAKSKTGITGWNVLCRWALCLSLSDPAIPYGPEIPSDSNVEMTWQTFGGEYFEIYDALMRQRCHNDGMDSDNLVMAKYFRLHLNRGINYLASKNGPKNSSDLLMLIK